MTLDACKKYHIEFGDGACKIVEVGKGPTAQVKLNDQILVETTANKYL